MICPTCNGEAETRSNDVHPDFDNAPPTIFTAPCMHCLGTGEVPDDLTLDDLFKY